MPLTCDLTTSWLRPLQERKFISFEYFNTHVRSLDYDDLVYGQDCLSALVAKHPATKDGLTRYLYEIILRTLRRTRIWDGKLQLLAHQIAQA